MGKEEFDTLCNLQIFTYLLVFHPYYRIRIQRTQSANNHGQLKKYGRTQRTFFMERGREELLVDQCYTKRKRFKKYGRIKRTSWRGRIRCIYIDQTCQSQCWTKHKRLQDEVLEQR